MSEEGEFIEYHYLFVVMSGEAPRLHHLQRVMILEILPISDMFPRMCEL